MLFLRRLEAFNLTREPRRNVASGQGNNAERGYTGDERDNPTGGVNSHYRLLRKQYESLKGSLNKVGKYMECAEEPAPSLGAVGQARADPDTPEAGLHWKQPPHKAVPNTSTNRCATTWGHGVPQAPPCPKAHCELALGEQLLSVRDGTIPMGPVELPPQFPTSP